MKNKTLKKNFIWNSVGSFIYLFCQWLLTLLVIRLSDNLTNAGYLALALSITNVFFNISCFNMRPYLVSDNTNEYTEYDYTTFRFITIILSLVLCVIYISFFGYNQSQFLCIVLYMIFKIGEAIVDLFHAFEQRKDRMDIGGISLLIRGLLSLISFYVGLRFTNNVNIAIIIMIVTTYAFILLYDLPNVLKFEKIKLKFNKKHITSLFIVLIPLAIGTILSTLSTAFPRQILEKMHGSSILGIYATIATPAVIVQVAATYIYNPLLTSFAKFRKEKDYKNTKSLFLKVILVIFLFAVLCTVGSIFLAKPILNILYGSRIAKHAYLFMPVIVYTSLTGFLWFFHNLLVVFRRIKTLMIIELIAFIICVAASSLFIKLFYMNGVSYILMFITIIMIICMIFVLIQEIKKLNNKEAL